MSKMFTFAYAGKNEILDNLVASFSELVDMRSKKDFVKNDEYNKKNALFNEALIKYCCEESGREFEGVDMVKDPMVVGRTSFKEAFDTVIAQVLTPVMPKLTSEKYNNLYALTKSTIEDYNTYKSAKSIKCISGVVSHKSTSTVFYYAVSIILALMLGVVLSVLLMYLRKKDIDDE